MTRLYNHVSVLSGEYLPVTVYMLLLGLKAVLIEKDALSGTDLNQVVCMFQMPLPKFWCRCSSVKCTASFLCPSLSVCPMVAIHSLHL